MPLITPTVCHHDDWIFVETSQLPHVYGKSTLPCKAPQCFYILKHQYKQNEASVWGILWIDNRGIKPTWVDACAEHCLTDAQALHGTVFSLYPNMQNSKIGGTVVPDRDYLLNALIQNSLLPDSQQESIQSVYLKQSKAAESRLHA